jgi:hypothetical protein
VRRIIFITLFLSCAGLSIAQAMDDYNSRFIKNYPPGFHSMWYKAERFYKNQDPDAKTMEKYRWDKYMSRITNTSFPFFPIPYDWEYGRDRTFNLPDFNANNWR